MTVPTSISTQAGSATRKHISFVAPGDLIPDPENPRKHSRAQIRAIAKSIEAFGFNAPVLIDRNRKIIAGHARFEAAKLLGYTQLPVVFLDHLSEVQARAYRLADNALCDRGTWDDTKLAIQLKELSELVLDFDVEAIGFELPEIDFRIQSLDTSDAADKADEFEVATGPAVSMTDDLWLLGPHRLYCGNSLDASAYSTLMNNEKAAAAFSDAPYNVKIQGHVSGNGGITHREFAMASGEMTKQEFTDFLTTSMKLICANTASGALIYGCMDWRHMEEMLAAGHASECELLNLCIWSKRNGGLGSLYRSIHELIFVFKNGKHAHLNNVQLGRFGRNRTNVWNYPGADSFPRKDRERNLDLHPTVKPIGMVSDAIMDSTARGDIVLDPFLGSGTTLLAAQRTGRRCYGIELDPPYVDTAIERWQRMTGQHAKNELGETFEEVKSKRRLGA